MPASSVPLAPPLAALQRKASVDAGFDLEPEMDGRWWRLRASGAPGVAWVSPLPGSAAALLALPLAAHVEGLLPSPGVSPAPDVELAFPPGAAAAVTCATPDALYAALRHLWRERTRDARRRETRLDATVRIEQLLGKAPTTEALAEVRRRVGQELFREALIDRWDGRCAVTGLAVPELLRASHAKPWAAATDAERLDPDNGLLLAPHLDLLFDRGFLAFDDAGQGVGSPRLAPGDWAALGIAPAALRLRRVGAGLLPYLAYHRAHVFRS